MAIHTEGLTKRYANGVTALKGIGLIAHEAEIVAVVGQNGAGKSTALNILATLIRPSGGVAEILGIPVGKRQEVRARIGVALQDAGLDPFMNAHKHFEMQGALYRVPKDQLRERRDKLLDELGLKKFANLPAGRYSGGMQRRLALALSVVNEPAVVILDEPTSGLDPRSRRAVWRWLSGLRGEGRTVVFSTHYLDEAQELCDRIYVLSDGRVVRQGPPDVLRRQAGEASLKVTIGNASAAEVRQALCRFAAPGILDSRIISNDPVTVDFSLTVGCESTTEHVMARMQEERFAVEELSLSPPSLEDAFLAIGAFGSDTEAPTGAQIEMAARRARGGRHWQ
jgi:ABC-2 type transport system ATP-binding protein